jgi:hypothetical protein
MSYIKKEPLLQRAKELQKDDAFGSPLIVRAIEEAPEEDVAEVKHGKWLPTKIPSYFGGVIYECSLCKARDGEHSSILGYYCWRCGAKMDGK